MTELTSVDVQAILKNIEVTRDLFRDGSPAMLVGTVCGSEGAQRFWQRKLEEAKTSFRAERVLSLHEDLPVNQAFGLLLMWQRAREHVVPGGGALFAFVFGEGSRATPLTETEGGQKPAILSFVQDGKRRLSTVEVALRYFSPVESYLRRSGFDGVVIKWGDEIQIPTLDLRGVDSRFRDADVVRFVSMQVMTEDLAENKDWVGVDSEGRVQAFIPRRPLAEMKPLAERGWVQKRGQELVGGINLGSIALSSDLMEALLFEFSSEVNNPDAERKKRPDLDPQLFTALTISTIDEPAARHDAWARALTESAAMRALEVNLPNVLERLRTVLERLEQTRGRPLSMVAMDFGTQYWGDIGQHRSMRQLFSALGSLSSTGTIARALAGLPSTPDPDGNWLAGDCHLGSDVDVRNSVLIEARVAAGTIADSVLVGTHCETIDARRAFDVESIAPSLTLAENSGSYRVVKTERVEVGPGERLTTVVFPEEALDFRVHEDDNLRDRAATYDTAIRGNPLSFREAHARISEADLEQMNRHRAELESAAAMRVAGEG